MKRLHITGCPRSGTTLALELLATCFQVDHRCGHEQSVFQPVPAGEGVSVSKQPTDIVHVHKVLAEDENLHVLYMLRDPRAVVTSRHASTNEYFSNYRVWKECESAARKLVDHPRVLQIRYEDLVSYPDIYQQIIQSKFPFLHQTHRFSDFSSFATPNADSLQALNGLRSIEISSLRKWTQHLPRVKSQLARFPQMQDDLEYRRYEPDTRWQSALAGVDDEVHACRYSDRKPVFKELEKSLRIWVKAERYRRHVRQSKTALPALKA